MLEDVCSVDDTANGWRIIRFSGQILLGSASNLTEIPRKGYRKLGSRSWIEARYMEVALIDSSQAFELSWAARKAS